MRTSTNEYQGRLYVFHDVTQERELDRLKNEFVSMVSHELRSPLTSIKGYVDLLQTGAAGQITVEQREFLDIIKANTDQLVDLINDLLDLSRMEAGRLELNYESMDLGLVIHQVMNTFRPQIDAKQQHLTLDAPGGTLTIWADRARLVQVLTNLISNAHKYTPAGGNIAIGVNVVDTTLQVQVKDDGIGISQTDQGKLFSRFFRAKNQQTQQIAGTGLGLVIARSLVELHGGTLSVSSVPGKGSTFTFTISLKTPATATFTPSAGKSILVVDEDRQFVDQVRRYLERAGFQVLTAHTGSRALALARTEKPALITLDLLLPEMDGFAVLEALRSDPTTRSIPVIIVSVLGEREQGKLLGAVDYISKPLNEVAFVQRIERVLRTEHPKLIMLAQTDLTSRNLTAGLLRHAGYEVQEASDSAKTIELAKEKQPGILFLDLEMPGHDGIEILRELRADSATASLLIVMMAGYEGISDDSRAVCAQLGAPTILTKPITTQKLATAIYQVLDRAREK